MFGTDENYVLPVQSLQKKEELLAGFEWLKSREEEIRCELKKIMPDYKKRAAAGGKLLEEIVES